jgi:hypothetical protein
VRSLTLQLRDRPALVCLDNCEQVLACTAEVADALLRSCPEVTVLATSREPLAMPGETVWRVPTLAEDEALTLFVERASLVRPWFTLDAPSEAAVRLMCVRLDGIPLALELAAAWLRTLTPQQIEDGLDYRFALLVRSPRGVRPASRPSPPPWPALLPRSIAPLKFETAIRCWTAQRRRFSKLEIDSAGGCGRANCIGWQHDAARRHCSVAEAVICWTRCPPSARRAHACLKGMSDAVSMAARATTGGGLVRLPVRSPTAAAAHDQSAERGSGRLIGSLLLDVRPAGGIPLALELAAWWLGTLTPQQIEAGLDDRFALLVRSPRGVRPASRPSPPRWPGATLLDESDRVVFRRLTVFAGGFTLPAARSVCTGELVAPTTCWTPWAAWSTSRWWWPRTAAVRPASSKAARALDDLFQGVGGRRR